MANKEIQNRVITHARGDMANGLNASQMHPEPQYTGFMDWVRANHAKQPSFGSELKAMLREAIKDIRATLHESWFGKPEHMAEAGTPLNPTMQLITEDMGNFHGYSAAMEEPSKPGQVNHLAVGQETGYTAQINQARSRGAEDRDPGNFQGYSAVLEEAHRRGAEDRDRGGLTR
jgi:hypothetical protein